MKKNFLYLFGLMLALVMAFGTVSAFAAAAELEEAVENPAVEPEVTLEDLAGSYIELFPEFDKEEYAHVWIERLEEVTGLDAETAEQVRTMMIGMMEAEVYGEDAVAMAAEDPAYSMFDCFFVNGPVVITVAGNTISGTDADGKEIFNHVYVFDGKMKMDLGEEMNAMYAEILSEDEWPTMDIYVAEDADDDFKYFAFAGDTPEETYHIEFRYGAEKEGLASYYEGPYAYWLAAGIPADYSEELITKCIQLFVDENAPRIAEMFSGEEASDADAEGVPDSEDNMLEAYKAYMKEWLMAEFEVNGNMTEEQIPEFEACIDANDYSQFPGDMFFNGMLENGVAMTFDEFVAASK